MIEEENVKKLHDFVDKLTTSTENEGKSEVQRETRSLEQIETDFRESRIITTPVFGMVDTNALKGKPKVDKLRLVLKNWSTPREIPEELVSKTQVYNYRYNINKYLKGESTRLSKRVFPLIEEYRNYIESQSLNQAKDKIDVPVIRRKKFKPSLEYLEQKYAKNINKMEQILKNWKSPKECLKIMKQTSINDYRKRVLAYLKGKQNKIPVYYHKLIEQYKDLVLSNLDPRTKGLKKIEKSSYKMKKDKDITLIMMNWSDKEYYKELGISRSSFYRMRDMVTRCINGDTTLIPEGLQQIIMAHKNEVLEPSERNNDNLFMTSGAVTACVNYPYYNNPVHTEDTSALKYTLSTDTMSTLKAESKQATLKQSEISVSFLEQLKKLGVKEFTVRF